MTNLSEKLIEKIKEEKIAPKPRWQFLAKDWFFWLMFCLSIIIGGLSFGAIIYFATDNDLVTFYWSRKDFLNELLVTLPYIWLGLIVFVAYLATVNLSATRTGYHFRPKNIVISSLVSSLLIGAVAYSFGFGSYLDNRFGQALPFYKSLGERRSQFWQQPDAARLAGKIKNLGKTTFEIVDFQQKTWIIQTTENTFWAPQIKKENGEMIRIVGSQKSPTEFTAIEIYPWHRPNFGPRPSPFDNPPPPPNFMIERNSSSSRSNQ